MFRAAILTLILMSAVHVLPANAQKAATPEDPHFSAALDLMEATHAKTNLITVVDTMIPLVLNQIRTQHPNASAAALQQFQTALRDEMVIDLDSVMQATAQIYEQHFTESELRSLSQFYRSDVGKKYIDAMPMIFKESAGIGAAWGREAGMRAAQRALQRLHDNGVEL